MLTIDENNNIAASAGVPASTDNLEVRAWPKTLSDFARGDARFMGIAGCHPTWPQSILFGRARLILLRSRGHHQSGQSLAVVPRHPLRRVLFEFLRVP
jgi:hypothetical protein